MKRTNLFKALATILAVAMVLAMVPMVAMATNTVSVDITYDYDTNKAVVKGSIDSDAELTMVTVLSDSELTSLDGFTDTELENAIMYIDQITSDGTEKTWTFDLRDTATGNVLTAFVGGTDATAVYESVKILAAAPKISIASDTAVFSDEDIVFTVENGSAEWADAATVEVNGEVDDTAVVTADSITLTGKTANVTSVIVKNADYRDAKWNGTVTVKDRMAVAKEAVTETNAKVAYDTDEGSAIEAGYATITLPADVADANGTGVAIAYSLKKGEDAVEVTDGVATVARPAEGMDADVYTVVATLSYGVVTDTVEKTVRVNAIGATAKITVDNITVLKASGAYGNNAKALVKVIVGTDVVDPASQSITGLYYSPQKEAFYGVVDAAVTGEELATALSNAIAVGEAEKFYFGVSADGRTNPNMLDFGYAGRLTKGTETPNDKQNIAMDVNDTEPNGLYNMLDFGAHGRKTKGTQLPVLAQ